MHTVEKVQLLQIRSNGRVGTGWRGKVCVQNWQHLVCSCSVCVCVYFQCRQQTNCPRWRRTSATLDSPVAQCAVWSNWNSQQDCTCTQSSLVAQCAVHCVCVGGQTGYTQSTWAVIAASLQKAGSQAVLLASVILITTSMGNQHNGPTRNCLMKCPDRTMWQHNTALP